MNKVERIAKALGLPDSGQDWGIEHADSARLQEFLDFAGALNPENDWEMEAMAELVLQSAEEAMESGSMSEVLRQRVVGFLRVHGTAFPLALAKWSAYPEDDGWHSRSLLIASGWVKGSGSVFPIVSQADPIP